MVWSFEWLNTQQRLGSSKAALLEAFARWRYQFFLYRPGTNQLVPFTADADGSFPRRDDDNILAIHGSAIDVVVRRLWECSERCRIVSSTSIRCLAGRCAHALRAGLLARATLQQLFIPICMPAIGHYIWLRRCGPPTSSPSFWASAWRMLPSDPCRVRDQPLATLTWAPCSQRCVGAERAAASASGRQCGTPTSLIMTLMRSSGEDQGLHVVHELIIGADVGRILLRSGSAIRGSSLQVRA